MNLSNSSVLNVSINYDKELEILRIHLNKISINLHKFLTFNKQNYFNQVISLTHKYPPLISYVKDYTSRNLLAPTTLLYLFNTRIITFNYELAMFLVPLVSVFHKNSQGKNALMVYCENYSTPSPTSLNNHFQLLDLIFFQFESGNVDKFNLLDQDHKGNNIINQLCAKFTISDHFCNSDAITFAYILAKCNTILNKTNMIFLLTNKDCLGRTAYQACLEYKNTGCLNILIKYQKILNLHPSCANIKELIDSVSDMHLQ